MVLHPLIPAPLPLPTTEILYTLKIYLQLNTGLEKEYFRNKISSGTQLLSKQPKKSCFGCRQGRRWDPPNLRHTLQLKLSSDKVKVDKNKDFYWEFGGKKYIYFLNVLFLNTYNIES